MSGPDQGLAQIAALLKNTTPPDVLETIAHISSDEVLTPPKLANRVLDLLPAHIWHDPRIKILDPAVKSGVFLREAAKRLMVGLADVIPDVTERREHIMRKMIYGIAITELTALMSRRSLYCASDATREKNPAAPENCYSAVIFETADGNIAFPETDHAYDVRGKCRVCGANRGDLDGEHREGRENHAYPFIHRTIEEIFGEDMQFDVIIGNPPYQIGKEKSSEGNNSARSIYHRFVEKAIEVNPKYISLLIPSRWMNGGRGVNDLKDYMLGCGKIREIHDFYDAKDIFPGVNVAGGVNYFLWDKDYVGSSLHTFHSNDTIKTQIIEPGQPIFLRNPVSRSVVEKVLSRFELFLSDCVSPRNAFSIPSKYSSKCIHGLTVIASNGNFTIRRDEVKSGVQLIDSYKIFISKTTSENGGGFDKSGKRRIFSRILIGGPGDICTESYLLIGPTSSKKESENLSLFLKTKFCRYLVGVLVDTQNISREKFRFVPKMDMSRTWTDADLYAHFGLTEDEIAFIEATIKGMP